MPPKSKKQTFTLQTICEKMDDIVTSLHTISGLLVEKSINIGKPLKIQRFVDNEDGTITDNKIYETEDGKEYYLIWDKEGSNNSFTNEIESAAEKYCKELSLAGFKDWKLPTREWLNNLVDIKRREPAIDPIFKCEVAGYWTSEPVAGVSDNAWIVFFYGGGSVGWGYRGGDYYVRAVRQVFIGD